MTNNNQISISLFCGGRGSSTIINELVRIPEIKLNLFINGYDNGLSTGALRLFIPGMLGPSDFRKNLSHLLEIHSPLQYAVISLLEYRFSNNFDSRNIIQAINDFNILEEVDDLKKSIEDLDNKHKSILMNYLRVFGKYYAAQANPIELSGFSLGNLIFAGAFVNNDCDFNKTLDELMIVFKSKINANLYNITNGDNRFLVGLKNNGIFLSDEALIVEKQDPSKMADIFLLNESPNDNFISKLNKLDNVHKKKYLYQIDDRPSISKQAAEILKNSDIIIYGPGTYYSSTFPSYKTKGLNNVLAASSAKLKVFIVNILQDNDTKNYTMTDLIDFMLHCMDDDNNKQSISHVLYNSSSERDSDGVRLGIVNSDSYKKIKIISGDYKHPVDISKHSGHNTVSKILEIYNGYIKGGKRTLEIFVSLYNRSLAVPRLLDEFCDIKWDDHFEDVLICINAHGEYNKNLPETMHVRFVDFKKQFPEIDYYADWINDSERSELLLILTGDGEYRLMDVFKAKSDMQNKAYGAIFGSRLQSRSQFIHSLTSAYTENKFLNKVSWIGAFIISFLFSLRSGMIFTDPLTGYRLFDRQQINKNIKSTLKKYNTYKTPSSLALMLLKSEVEIGEIPIYYRTYSGFTDSKWRIKRAIKNIFSIIFFRKP